MKLFWKQMLITLLSFSICLPSYGQLASCPSFFRNEKVSDHDSFFKRILSPQSIRNFDYDLYWKIRTNDISSLHLTPKELKSFEVKIALIDRLLPKDQGRWLKKIMGLGLFRAREINRLVSWFSLENLQDPYLRKQFITQFYLLNETPWLGFKKSLEHSRTESAQEWVERSLEPYLLNHGLEQTLRQFGFTEPTQFEKAKTRAKKFFANGWFSFPKNLPWISKNFKDPLIQEIFEGHIDITEPQVHSAMQRDHMIDNYNELNRVYRRAALVVLTVLIYILVSEQQKESEKKLNQELLDLQKDPEYIKKQNDAFSKAMEKLDEIDRALDQFSAVNTKSAIFEETILLSEQLNGRKPSLSEQQQIRSQLND